MSKKLMIAFFMLTLLAAPVLSTEAYAAPRGGESGEGVDASDRSN